MDKTGLNLGIIFYSNIVVQCEKGKGKGSFLSLYIVTALKLTDKPELMVHLYHNPPPSPSISAKFYGYLGYEVNTLDLNLMEPPPPKATHRLW